MTDRESALVAADAVDVGLCTALVGAPDLSQRSAHGHRWRSAVTSTVAVRPLPLDRPFTSARPRRPGVSRRAAATLLVARGWSAASCRGGVRRRAGARRPRVPAAGTAPGASRRARSSPIARRPGCTAIDLLPRTPRRPSPIVGVPSGPATGARRAESSAASACLRARRSWRSTALAVTSPIRTALDLGRLLRRFDALAALDQFLRVGVDRDELLGEVARFAGYRGVVQLRALVALADRRAESVAESALRLHWHDAGCRRRAPVLGVRRRRRRRLPARPARCRERGTRAEYDGVEFHADRAERDAAPSAWLAERGWHIDVFAKDDVYAERGPDAAAAGRRRRGDGR